MTIEELMVITAKINRELENVVFLEKELTGYGLFPEIRVASVGGFSLQDNAACRIISSILHDYYVAIENIFKCIARRIDGAFPPGDHWHKELLEQMTLEIAGVRPALIKGATFTNLDRLRGFRHVFRNVYGFNLAPDRIRDLLAELPATSSMIKKDIEEFLRKMESLLSGSGS